MKVSKFILLSFSSLLLAGCTLNVDSEKVQSFNQENVEAPSCSIYPVPAKVTGAGDITDFNRYYKPREFNFDMFNPSSKYSWHRFKQSEHFFVFWESGFGSNPNSSSLPYEMRVDIDDLLNKAEQFYRTNISTLKMATPGNGKSYLDYYKLQIYVLYQKEWLATGSGYDNVIGALWVNPATCKPVGKVIAHEIGHTFQYQVYCDKLLNGQKNDFHAGFRYGYGVNGTGGCPYWEQCANWQAFQDYPSQAFSETYYLFTKNCHRHFNHEWMRYQSVWLQYYLTNKFGIEAFSRIWKESYFPEDTIDSVIRLFYRGNTEAFWNDYYEYASHAITYDYGYIHNWYNSSYSTYSTKLVEANGKYRVAYESCPGTSGFNVIKLNTPKNGTSVFADLNALTVGSALSPNDAGNIVNGDSKVIGNTRNYNNNFYNNRYYTDSNFRFGFVGVKNGKAYYGPMTSGTNAKASMDIRENFDQFYLVVAATPKTYVHQFWNDKEEDDLQWPYEVSFTNTNVEGQIENGVIAFGLALDSTKTGYELQNVDISAMGALDMMAHTFKLSAAQTKSIIQSPAFGTVASPKEGKIVMALTDANGNLDYKYTATAGFWCKENGNAGAWGPGSPVYFEYNPSKTVMTFGHLPYNSVKEKTYIVKPTFVYMKNGKIYTYTMWVYMYF